MGLLVSKSIALLGLRKNTRWRNSFSSFDFQSSKYWKVISLYRRSKTFTFHASDCKANVVISEFKGNSGSLFFNLIKQKY